MEERGWEVITVDIESKFEPDIVADIINFHWGGKDLDLIWLSMPCLEFSREDQPWTRKGIVPDMSLVLAGLRIIDQSHPRFWVCENVRGAIKWFRPYMGDYRYHVGPFYLWGFFPIPGKVNQKGWVNKINVTNHRAEERAKIPFSLSNSIAEMIELQPCLVP